MEFSNNLTKQNLQNILNYSNDFNKHKGYTRVFGLMEGILQSCGRINPSDKFVHEMVDTEVRKFWGGYKIDKRKQTMRAMFKEFIEELD